MWWEPSSRAGPRFDQPRTGSQRHPDARRARERLDDAHELRGAEAALVLDEPRREVEDAERAVRRLEPRLEDVRVGQVPLRAALPSGGPDREAPPALGSSSSAPKTGGESKRGIHDHTIAPSRRTSAEIWQLPIRPRSVEVHRPASLACDGWIPNIICYSSGHAPRPALPRGLPRPRCAGTAATSVVTRTTRGGSSAISACARRSPSGRRGEASRATGGPRPRLKETLADITRDERIMGAGACCRRRRAPRLDDRLPDRVLVRAMVDRARAARRRRRPAPGRRRGAPCGPVHVSVTGSRRRTGESSAVVLVHDLSFVSRREATTRNVLSGRSSCCRSAAAIVTVLAARLAWRGWTDGAAARAAGDGAGSSSRWSATSARSRSGSRASARPRRAAALEPRAAALHADAAPARRARGDRGQPRAVHPRARTRASRVLHPASGLVTALEPVMRACSGSGSRTAAAAPTARRSTRTTA
jgi:hypothetical protein